MDEELVVVERIARELVAEEGGQLEDQFILVPDPAVLQVGLVSGCGIFELFRDACPCGVDILLRFFDLNFNLIFFGFFI